MCRWCLKRPKEPSRSLCINCIRSRESSALNRLIEKMRWRMSGLCEDCGAEYQIPGKTQCETCSAEDRRVQKALDLPAPPVENRCTAYRPVIIWRLRKGKVWEYLGENHSQFVAELWNRQDNPIKSKPVSRRTVLCRKWPLAS